MNWNSLLSLIQAAGPAIGLLFFVVLWIVHLSRNVYVSTALRKEIMHAAVLDKLMEGKDLEHFLHDNGVGPDPDPEDPLPPRPTIRGIQSVELD